MKGKGRTSLPALAVVMSLSLMLVAGCSTCRGGNRTWVQLNDPKRTIVNMGTISSFKLGKVKEGSSARELGYIYLNTLSDKQSRIRYESYEVARKDSERLRRFIGLPEKPEE